MTIQEQKSLVDSQIESISHIKESLFDMRNFSPKVKNIVRPTTTMDGSTSLGKSKSSADFNKVTNDHVRRVQQRIESELDSSVQSNNFLSKNQSHAYLVTLEKGIGGSQASRDTINVI